MTATITFPTKHASQSCYEDRYPILKFPVRKRGPKGKDSKYATKTLAHSFLEVSVARLASQATSVLSTSAQFRYLTDPVLLPPVRAAVLRNYTMQKTGRRNITAGQGSKTAQGARGAARFMPHGVAGL